MITETYINLMTGQSRQVIYTRVEDHNFNISPLYLSSDGGYYTHGVIGWVNVDKYLKHG